MTDWYYAVDNAQIGPVTTEYLRMLLAEKRIDGASLVWNASMTEWRPAASVPELAGEATPLFPVANWKLALMMAATFGIYQVFWGYRHWKAIRTRTGQDLMPFARGFFAIFFFHALAREVNDAAADQRIERRLPVGPLTALFLILWVSQRLPDPYWLIWFAIVIPLMYVQQLANEVIQKASPLADRNARIRSWNWLAIVLGIPFFILAVIGTFMPEP